MSHPREPATNKKLAKERAAYLRTKRAEAKSYNEAHSRAKREQEEYILAQGIEYEGLKAIK